LKLIAESRGLVATQNLIENLVFACSKRVRNLSWARYEKRNFDLSKKARNHSDARWHSNNLQQSP